MNNSLQKPKYTAEEYEEFFKQIREVLEEHRHITKYQLMNGTGIPMEVIRYFIKEGRLEETVTGLNANDGEKTEESPEERRKRLAENFRKELSQFKQTNGGFDRGSKLVKDLDKKFHHGYER